MNRVFDLSGLPFVICREHSTILTDTLSRCGGSPTKSSQRCSSGRHPGKPILFYSKGLPTLSVTLTQISRAHCNLSTASYFLSEKRLLFSC